MGRIVQLSKNVINQIAAGEVIERPYSVVKELVENSVDAGATKVSIEVANECRNIRVADNGSGIHPDDIILAFSKHATSKISSGEDLYNVKTMGFRGEALASIISISRLTCITRTEEFDFGTKVECENSEVKKSQTGCAVGTIMDIKDLFYNLPARLKFLKSQKTEFAYINELIQTLALVHTNVAFELKNNGKTIIKTTGQGDTLQVLKEVFSEDIAKNLREVFKTDKMSGLKISGFVSTPDYTRASKKDYYMYVNSRMVKCPIFQKSIDTAYKSLIGSRYPFIILNYQNPVSSSKLGNTRISGSRFNKTDKIYMSYNAYSKKTQTFKLTPKKGWIVDRVQIKDKKGFVTKSFYAAYGDYKHAGKFTSAKVRATGGKGNYILSIYTRNQKTNACVETQIVFK